MKISQETRDKYVNMKLKQLDHLTRQLEARNTRVKNATLRKNWLDSQNRANYRQEYDRIRSELHARVIPHANRARIVNRAQELANLFSRGNV